MTWQAAAAASVFAATFLLLATGRIARRHLPRGAIALSGGVATALLLGVSPRAIDLDVILLIVALTALAGLLELSGGFAGLRRRLVGFGPRTALAVSVGLMAATSALLLNDAAVLILVPFLLPALQARGFPPVRVVALLAVAANIGSLLTPFGNPQNAILAAAAGLSVPDVAAVQAAPFAAGLAALAVACWATAAKATPQPPPPAVQARGRALSWCAVAAFVALAVAQPSGMSLGVAAAVAAAVLALALLPLHGRPALRVALRAVDPNVVALFAGLYLLTAGLPHWLPAFDVARLLAGPVRATAAVVVGSNVLGNVPAVLSLLRLDPAWTVRHAQFLISTSTLGGALLLTGSAASLLAADKARSQGVHVTFWAFARIAVPVAAPVLAAAAWWTWRASP